MSAICQLALAGFWLLEDPSGQVSTSELFRRGDALAREKKYDEALLSWKEAYLRVLPRNRDLPFTHPVPAA